MARARKGGDPAAKRFQASLQTLKRTGRPEEAAPAEAAAAIETGQPVAERPKRAKAKTKVR